MEEYLRRERMMRFAGMGSAALAVLLVLASPAGALQDHGSAPPSEGEAGIYGMNVRGPAGNGDADDGLINAAAKAACSGKTRRRTLYIPSGVYELLRPIVLPCGLTMIGDGDTTVLHPISSSDGIAFTTTERVQIQNLAITYSSSAAKGTRAIRCDVPTGSSSTGLTIRDVTINNADTGISVSNCAFFVLSNNRIFSFGTTGISVANPTNADVGDGVVENNSIFNFGEIQNQIGILWVSGGGIRIMNNKFGALYGGARFNLANKAKTSQIFIQGNSFDTMNAYGVELTRMDSVGTLSDVLWNGNVCTSCMYGLSIPRDPNGSWVNNVVAVGNTFIGQKRPGVRAFIIDSAQNIAISANVLFSNDDRSVPLSLGRAVSGAVIGPMVMAGKWSKIDSAGSGIDICCESNSAK